MKFTSKTFDFAGKKLTLETGKLAKQATASILARLGDTVVLATVVASKNETTLDYFPLSVDYVERLYAGGKIKGSRWVKREGRPSDAAILTGRLIDRSIRPFFPKEYKHDIQIVVTVLSVDGENEPDILSLIAVSTALSISEIPWNGPVGAIRIGFSKENGEEKLLLNPGGKDLEVSELDIVVSQTKEKTVMIEAGALQVPEKIVSDAISQAHEENKKLITFIEELVKEIGVKKVQVHANSAIHELAAKIEKSYKTEVEALIPIRANKEGGSSHHEDLINKIWEDEHTANPDVQLDKKTITVAFEKVFYKIIRDNVIKREKRADGRRIDEIRALNLEVGVLPRTHGSAIFERGLTQALSIVTLGSPRLGQLIESAEGEETKRYIHHYSGPPYSVGETGRVGFLSRREIGHGALAERALLSVIPAEDKFPYTIRVVSEVLSQNGSSSMASTCGSTLALMDAGVPIIKPVAGISIGMMSNDEKYVLLTDIVGLEDFSGDMDFKVAGTDTGITAIQLDVKNLGLTMEQIKEILERARVARLFILGEMAKLMPEPRPQISEYAPKIVQLKIPVEKIGEIIGPSGKIIKNIIATSGATVDVEDDGTVSISAVLDEQIQKAVGMVSGIIREVQVGEVFENSEVKRILPFGAFVEILPNKEGMVHVSQMAAGFVKDPNTIVKIGDKVKVRVMEIDEQGRINLSMKFGEPENQDSSQKSFEKKDVAAPHPLSMQFERERREKEFRGRPQRPPFRKKSY